MNLSRPFIERPVATTLLTLGVAIAGALSFLLMPVAPLPQVEFPVITVTANLPGASPETMAATVATPLERALGTIAGVNEITSSSSLSSTRVTLQFDLGKNIDSAAREVQAAINAARVTLPSSLPGNPVYRKANPADSPVMILSLTSKSLTRGQMYDAASTVLAQRISQIEGVGNVNVGGGALPAVRVALDLPTVAATGVSLEEVRGAIANNNVNRPKGVVEVGDRQWQIGANDQAKKAAEYLPLVVSWKNGAALRLSDIATVTDSVQDARNMGLTDGEPSVQLIIYRQPGANILETVERVKDLLPRLRATIPDAIDMEVVMERTTTIRASLREVERALAISIALVVIVVFAFLRSGRATIIPAISVPVSLLGTFIAMYLLGYSLNNLSLMALTIATGFVVDDAIVVLENIMRYIEEGMKPVEAALMGAKEVGFTVLSMSLSLIAVFIPILAMGGIIGRLFREFAVTLSVAILVSLVVSLTVTPMLCARWLRRGRHVAATHDDGSRKHGGAFGLMHRGYAKSLGWALNHPALLLIVFALTIAANVWLYREIPKGFFPQQDTGLMIGGIQADQATSFQSMSSKVSQFVEIVKKDPAVAHVTAFTGGGQRNSGLMFVVLKPLKERAATADEISNRLRPKLAQVAGASLFLQSAQDLRAGGRSGNAQYQYTLQSDDLALLRQWEPAIRATLSNLTELTDVNTDAQDKGLQTSLLLDRDAMARFGITVRNVDATLNDAYGQRQIATLYEALNQYRVVMEADGKYLQDAESLKNIYLTGSGGKQIPLSQVATVSPTNTPLAVNHQGQFAASTVSFNLASGVSIGQATEAIDTALARIGVPTGITASFQGGAKIFQQSLSSQPLLILAAIITIYLVLGMLYESLVHPITILSTLPSAGVGAVLALMMFKMEFSLIALIGVILLIGIVKKNAIMMIDVAIETERREGLDPREAIYRACLLRFRPIMMTTIAALFGALPLALGSGDGAELRQPLGVSIVGGLILSQLLTLYTTPVVYLALDRLRNRVMRKPTHRPHDTGVAVKPALEGND
ncbi:MAG TPA: multidrug efflux RND transporter permease subunit [Casimicrobium huifangae]|jgi:multidrug efflux pump|uniref:multidrug efflux RND transporter permease subunit n=1 Tax=Casimicrobium huifangae TaxID=2591109 RepID=UPI0012EB15BA|nr:multidrug efflux RND transporter permease subunit [Casimicrobium huifangae]HOB00967.1 multidrug efflux RND transporter permease subunit [Casimicrobium huifangae]HQA32655.1 multidrug efflux RND transporter permease subunit [Casimicrobium huifangae]HQD64486.1 multidrug efflux RND transporter permease subunit [Casimicrobium huifangae]